MDKVKFAELVAKTGIHFGAADGHYDDKEKGFVHLFTGFLKVNTNIDVDTVEIINRASKQVYTINELINETRDIMADLPEAERKGTLESFANFIETVICIDGDKSIAEQSEFKTWKSSLM